MIPLCLVLMVIVTFELVVFGADPPPRAIVTAEAWPPWEEVNAQGEVTGGFAIDLVAEMLTRMNIDMVPHVVPFKRALVELEDGESDFILMITPSVERNRYMVFTEPILIDSYRLCYSIDRFPTFEWSTWEELVPYKIGVVRGYIYGEVWQQAVKTYHYKLEEVTTDQLNVKKLLGQRFDFTLLLESTIKDILKDVPEAENKIKFASKPILEIPLCFGLSTKSSLVARLPEMNATLHQMRQDGTFKRILKNFYQETP